MNYSKGVCFIDAKLANDIYFSIRLLCFHQRFAGIKEVVRWMHLIGLILGICLFLGGLGYLFHPKIILKVNAFARDAVFRDSRALLENRRIGVILLLLSFVILVISVATFH
jgi:uncharacterized protein YqgC (DUF456 family)